MNIKERNMAVLAKHTAAEASFDMDTTLATLHPDTLFEDQPIGLRLNGRDACSRHYQIWWDAFDLHSDGGVLHWIDDDLLIAESHFVGTHKGEFLGVAPTHNEIRFPFTVVVRFKDGYLSGEKFYYDLNDVMRQLGQPSFNTFA